MSIYCLNQLQEHVCECCRNLKLDEVTPWQKTPLLICGTCKGHLEKNALSPREWYHLIVIHGPLTWPLGNQYYYADGEATLMF